MESIGFDIVSVSQIGVLADIIRNEVLLAMALLAITSTLTALGIPGIIIPISFASGALLGGGLAILVVASGALLGSQLLFIIARYAIAGRVREKLGERFEIFERYFKKGGVLYIAGLRIVGTPHFLVTGASALTSLRATSFATATLIGFLPAISLTAAAGSVL